MKRGIVFVTLLLMVFSMMSYGKKLATLPGLLRPYFMVMDDQQLYVCHGIEARIYSLKDFSLKAKFGKPGEGPQEFKPLSGGAQHLEVYPHTDFLIVSSLGKVSFYSKEGIFIKERKVPVFGEMIGRYKPIGDKYVGMGIAAGAGGVIDLTFNLYDHEFKKIKEIYKQGFMKGGRLTFPIITPIFFIEDNKIFIPGGQEFGVNILNAEGKKINAIIREYERLKVHDGYKKGVHDYFKLVNSAQYPIIRNMLTFADIFPAIQGFALDRGKIYIQTYLKKDGKHEFFIYDLDGKFVKRLFLPVAYMNEFMPYPITFKNGVIYQLVENEDEEEWELHAVEIK